MSKKIDVTGQKFGRLTVLNINHRNSEGRVVCECICECGKIVFVNSACLRSGRTKSCGCYNKEAASKRSFKDLTGQKFGRLTAIKYVDTVNRQRRWLFQCACGVQITKPISYVTSGNTSSCGCIKKEQTAQMNFKDLSGQKFGLLTALKVDGKYKNGCFNWICECECGGNITVPSNLLLNGHVKSCKCLRQSFGTLKIEEFLINNNLTYKKEHKMRGCKHKYLLPFDFAVFEDKKLKTLIEFDGRQHTTQVEYFGGKQGLEDTQTRDEIKNSFCKENSIPLLRISYKEEENIESILTKELLDKS